MDALFIVPTVAVSLGGTYYLGKVCLKLIVGSLEHGRGTKHKASKTSSALGSTDTLLS